MARKVKSTGKALWTRTMYPGRFCEACFCHHEVMPCPDYGVTPREPTYRQADMLGTWVKIRKEEAM